MRELFNIPAEKETKLWNRYMSNTYEQLSKLDSTVQDAGLYDGQVRGITLFFFLDSHVLLSLSVIFFTWFYVLWANIENVIC